MREIQAVMVMILLVVYAICIPAYKALNPKGFPVYLGWALFVGVVWVFVVILALT